MKITGSRRLAVLFATTICAAAGLAPAAVAAGAPKPPQPQVKPVRPAPPKAKSLAGNIQYVAENGIEVGAGAWAYGSAHCPSGTKAVGGGEYNNSNYGGVLLSSSYPEWSGDTWTVTVRNTHSVPITLYPWVACAGGLTAYQLAWTDYLTIPAGQLGGGNMASCPSGTTLYGGGTAVTAPGAMVTNSSSPADGPPRSWYAYSVNQSPNPARQAVVAVCGNGLANVQTVFEQAYVEAGGDTYSDASCPRGTSVLSGGARTAAPVRMTASFPNDGSSWEVYVKNTSSEGGFNFLVAAICAS